MENQTNKKLKIGMFIDTFFPMIDGVIIVVDNYAKRLSKFADVTVFCPAPRKGKYDDSKFEYKVVRCKSSKLLDLDYDLPLPSMDNDFKEALKNAKLDVVHIHSPFGVGKFGIKYAKKHKIPVVATMHTNFKFDIYKATKSKLITRVMLNNIVKVFDKCDECFAVNNKIASVYNDYGTKVMPSVLNNGTDLEFVEDEKLACETVNKKYGLKDDDFVCLFVGRINTLKNILFIVDALKIVKDNNHNFKMLFVGGGNDEHILRDKIEETKLTEDVLMCGKVMDRQLMAYIFRRAQLFLFPSVYDASSLVQIEAASQKTPTIFLEGAPTSATVEKDVNGFIIENDVNAFAEKIMQVMDDKEYYERIADGCFRDLFVTWDDCVKKAYGIYLRHIERKKKEIAVKKMLKNARQRK